MSTEGYQDKNWNWRPSGRVQNNPIFNWPPVPRKILAWYARGWKPFSEYSIFVVMALATWAWAQHPSSAIATTEGFSHFEWIGFNYLRNFLYILVLAGGLHLYFYRFKKQESELKYDYKFMSEGKRYTFGSQVYDNMFWTLGSGVLFWTFYESLVLLAQAKGIAPTINWKGNEIWFVAGFLIIPIWISFHFYWVHRFLHWPPLYRISHALHHRNVSTGPWSGLSMHPIEHSIYLSSMLIHFVLPTHPIHVLFHAYSLTASAVWGHTGFDSLLIKGKRFMDIGHFHHQLHHRYFECNYGTVEIPWDVWFGTFDDGTPEARKRLRELMKDNMKANQAAT